MNRKKKNAAQQRQTSRELIDIQKITEYGLLTSHGELVFFSIEPTNLSVHRQPDLCPDDCPQRDGGDRNAGPQFQGEF